MTYGHLHTRFTRVYVKVYSGYIHSDRIDIEQDRRIEKSGKEEKKREERKVKRSVNQPRIARRRQSRPEVRLRTFDIAVSCFSILDISLRYVASPCISANCEPLLRQSKRFSDKRDRRDTKCLLTVESLRFRVCQHSFLVASWSTYCCTPLRNPSRKESRVYRLPGRILARSMNRLSTPGENPGVLAD